MKKVKAPGIFDALPEKHRTPLTERRPFTWKQQGSSTATGAGALKDLLFCLLLRSGHGLSFC
jgi:hypothetical protein